MASGCASTTGSRLGLSPEGTLSPCPASPNCVSSDADNGGHNIPALAVRGDPETAWDALLAHLDALPGCKIVVREQDYLRAEARTRLLRFVDDVEFHKRPAERIIAMRSASRVGFSDLGTNRRRLESIRSALAEAGVVETVR